MKKFIQSCLASVMLFTVIQVPSARADEMSDAKAASDAFYTALATLDDGTAMSKVFAQQSYITFVGPRSQDIVIGGPALKAYFAKSNTLFRKREAHIADSIMHVSSKFAWEVGHEQGENVMADGKQLSVDWVVTNILEKQADGHWLMVSHHVQPGAK